MLKQGKRFSWAGALWLIVASYQAPFAHFHPEDPGHEHGEGALHIHLGWEHASAATGPVWDHSDHDETAVSQEWAPAKAPRLAIDPAEAVFAAPHIPALVSAGAPREFVVRSHDPPLRVASPARAPPV